MEEGRKAGGQAERLVGRAQFLPAQDHDPSSKKNNTRRWRERERERWKGRDSRVGDEVGSHGLHHLARLPDLPLADCRQAVLAELVEAKLPPEDLVLCEQFH